MPILVKIDQEMRPWECSQTDRHTDTQTQTDFIICPMLYAIAMGQIKQVGYVISTVDCLHAYQPDFMNILFDAVRIFPFNGFLC